ncbi:speckle-type POZ protein-like protein [Leptotrombidium deliense]|uniref:Speckle-type POZ protein-like protein n=1 Tax=Leptotrombidium deliense TaxID=299467 RepID=A0A443SLX5_9ACAR|nr:speckle-type POZ protein-like protein [Leptotrombidium deliense]
MQFKLKYSAFEVKRKQKFVALKGSLSILGENGCVLLTLDSGVVEVGENCGDCRFIWSSENLSQKSFEKITTLTKRMTFLSELWGIFEENVQEKKDEFKLTVKECPLLNMFMVETLCDFTVIVDEHPIKCHKSVLMSESDVFQAMFDNDFREKKESCMRIDEFSYDSVHSMIKFMYCHEVDNIKDLVFDLLLLSDKYNVKKLKMLCENYISSKISVDNFFNIYKTATYNNTPILKQNLRDFLFKNYESLLKHCNS